MSDQEGTVFTFIKGLPTPIGKVTNMSIGGLSSSQAAVMPGTIYSYTYTVDLNGGVELIDLSHCKPQEMVSNFRFDLLKAVTMVEALPCVDGGCRNATANGRRTCARCEAVEHLKYLCKGGA